MHAGRDPEAESGCPRLAVPYKKGRIRINGRSPEKQQDRDGCPDKRQVGIRAAETPAQLACRSKTAKGKNPRSAVGRYSDQATKVRRRKRPRIWQPEARRRFTAGGNDAASVDQGPGRPLLSEKPQERVIPAIRGSPRSTNAEAGSSGDWQLCRTARRGQRALKGAEPQERRPIQPVEVRARPGWASMDRPAMSGDSRCPRGRRRIAR